MKKKHYIKDISDIKYCEKHGLKIYPRMKGFYFEFHNGVWGMYDENDLLVSYQTTLFVSDNLYYYEEKSEEQKEATEKDIGKLCWFWGSNDKNMELGILEGVNCDEDEIEYESGDGFCYHHCRKLSPAEVSEITGYKVEKKE